MVYANQRLVAVFQTAISSLGVYQGDALACCNIDPSGLGREWLSLHRHPIFRKLNSENRTSAITSKGPVEIYFLSLLEVIADVLYVLYVAFIL